MYAALMKEPMHQIATFRKAQSEYLGLAGEATLDELLKFEALYKQSKGCPKFKYCSNTWSWPSSKLLSYDAWKAVVEAGISPAEAELAYDAMFLKLKEKYGVKSLGYNGTKKIRPKKDLSIVISGAQQAKDDQPTSPRTFNVSNMFFENPGAKYASIVDLCPKFAESLTIGSKANMNDAGFSSYEEESRKAGSFSLGRTFVPFI